MRELAGGPVRAKAVLFVAPNKPERDRDDPARLPDLGRFALVLLYAPESNLGIRALVDLRKIEVVEVNQTPPAGVPLNEDDLAEAWGLARSNERVRALLGAEVDRFRPLRAGESREATELEVQALGVRGSKGDPCEVDRCLALIFRRGNRYLEGRDVLVNLTRRQVQVRTSASNGEERRPK
ncbi:MAG: hypothetical protein ACJ75H_01670 [Thermoanaerobaculia bacterium]